MARSRQSRKRINRYTKAPLKNDYDFIKEFNKLGYDDKSANKLLRNMKMRIEMDSIEITFNF